MIVLLYRIVNSLLLLKLLNKAKLTNDAKEKDNKFNFINFIITFNLLAI